MAEPFINFSQNQKLSWTSPLDFLVDLFRWFFILGITLVILALLLKLLGERPGHIAQEISAGFVQFSDSRTPPAFPSGDWRALELPHDWRKQPGTKQDHAWYGFEASLNAVEDGLWAIYLPTQSMNAAVYVNGELVGSGGDLDESISRNWSRPLYFIIPGSLIQPGNNQVMLRLAAAPAGSGLLSTLYLGKNRDLRGFYQTRVLMKITLPIVASIAAGLLALASLVIFASESRHKVYGWYGFGTLVWSVHNMNLFIVHPPVSNLLWDWAWYMSLGWFIVAIPPYVHGLLGYERRKIEIALLTYAALGTAGLAYLATRDHVLMDFVARRIWTVSWLAIGLYPTMMMIFAAWRSRDIETQWLLTAALLIFVLGIHDCLMSNGLLSRVDGYLMHYSIPIAIAVFGWLLLSRFVRSMTEVELLNKDLHRRVAERTEALEHSYQQMNALERQQAIQEERERILRDMHDGVGGQLVATLAMAEGGEAASELLTESLRETLDELRLTIDAIELEQGDLASALGTLRGRIEPAFANHSIRVHWEMADLPPTPSLGPAMLTHVIRILREAISNALRHAGADNIWVRIRPEDPLSGARRLRIEVEDDGAGIRNHEQTGHGLANMRYRAELLGANLEILSSQVGTKIVLICNT